MASVALSAGRERRTENAFHMLLNIKDVKNNNNPEKLLTKW